VKNGSSILILPVNEVLYIEAYDDYVKVFNKDTFYLKKKTMGYYEETLHPSQFVRIHRSFMLNIDYLTRMEPLDKSNMQAVLKNGVKLPVSRSGYAKLKEILNL
jgi:two-component system LytT family response regulator